ncbi:Spy/CpxP family protein refolding chaperone [Neosynechococcus sphagnicola]|uniref:Spy/CpxP family protein refolding chaperone n=1 Tax=Neosynechococcus sphagnicola TaxID=1501145 RepID=UPI00068D06B6|nr:Spy/CpxP family protein refolding chaperone [Neosynechococcus sphagnicola]
MSVLTRLSLVMLPALLSCGGTVLLAAQSPALTAQEPAKPLLLAQNSQPARRMPGWLRTLNLNPDQMQQMQSVLRQYKPQMSERMQALQQAQAELQSLMAGTASDSQVRDKYHQIETLRQQLASLRFESTLAIRRLLTPEQRRLLADQINRQRQERQRPMNSGNSNGTPDQRPMNPGMLPDPAF